ncbi:MAG TPA: alpha-L-rhamnosidase C-terminal domain-containing protein, partial [Candidatus Dormibacteraeota bacterium]|nr:alpha-L-rhamnosidase C-terminal domain-containing protein [Candidatus Dormibacteraeota bacterium]
WERWDSYTKEHGFGGGNEAPMNSFSHYCFGAISEWMFRYLAGIDSDGPGYSRIVIRPMPPTTTTKTNQTSINWVRAHYDSIRGRIAVSWKKEGNRFELDVTIPANTTATVRVPTSDSTSITESGKALKNADGAKLIRQEADAALLEIGSGTYHFVAGNQ